MNKRTVWTKIKDENVRLHWKCTNDDCEGTKKEKTAVVDPTFAPDSGNPVCSWCDDEMSYVKTTIKLYFL